MTLQTDHRPLVAIFDATKVSTPTRMSRRLGRWALQLSQYKFKIEYRKSVDHSNADALSWLPVRLDASFQDYSQQETEIEDYVANVEQQVIKGGPIQYHQLQEYTKQDQTLQEVIQYIRKGWPDNYMRQ